MFITLIVSGASLAVSILVMYFIRTGLKRFILDKKQRTIEFFINLNTKQLFRKFTDFRLTYVENRKQIPFETDINNIKSEQKEKEYVIPYLEMYEIFSIGIQQELYDFDIFIKYTKQDFLREHGFLKNYMDDARKEDSTTWENYIYLYDRITK